MVVKPLTDLFSQGGPVMVFIAGASVLAWYLALRTWWAVRRHLIAVERIKSHRASADGPYRFGAEARAARLEYTLRVLGALAVILPLLGLLGTVLGMLAGFDVIQLHGTGQPRLLARGIGQALMTTQAGLWAAVPVLFFHHILRDRVRLLRDELEMLSHAGANGANRRGG
jgi:biopolymer transport protein ExbB